MGASENSGSKWVGNKITFETYSVKKDARGELLWLPEKGNQDINIKRSEEAIDTDSEIVAVSCPFCSTMMSDGMTAKQKNMDVLDIAQMIEKAEDLWK